MSSVNKVIILGRLGTDPEIRYTPNGMQVTNLSVATSKRWRDQSGNKQERTEWHRIVCYERTAEIVKEYLKKGQSAYFEGELRTRKYQDRDGQDRYITEIIADKLTLLGRDINKADGGEQDTDKTTGTTTQTAKVLDDDLPF